MKTVLHVGPHVPVEWIAAHGLTPRRLVLHVDRNGACQAGICPHAQAVLHEARSHGGMLLVLAETCDQMRRAAAMLSLETERDGFFLFHVPSTQGPAAVQLYRDECLRLTRFLLRSGGTLPRQDMPFQPATELRRSAGTRGVPIAVIGGPLLAEHETLLAVIEQLGGAVVVDGMEGGERSVPRLPPHFRPRDLLDTVVSARFDGIPDVFRRPNVPLCHWLLERVHERGVRGLICVSYTWCDLWRAEQRYLAAEAKIPALFLELGTETQVTGRNITRIEAFLESLTP